MFVANLLITEFLRWESIKVYLIFDLIWFSQFKTVSLVNSTDVKDIWQASLQSDHVKLSSRISAFDKHKLEPRE